MSAQHTPGPWALSIGYDGSISVAADGPRRINLTTAGAPVIADVFRHDDAEHFSGEANACLIAAAPDLLAELKAARIALKEAELLLHKVYTEHGIVEIDDGDGTWVSVARAADRMDAAIDASNAVIEKATGAPA